MVMNYAVSVLKKAAYELGGEILSDQAFEIHVESADEISKMAYQILTGSFTEKAKGEKLDRFIELLKAMSVLSEHTQ